MFKDAKLKRREALIKNLKNEIKELKQNSIDAEELKNKRIETDALIYQLNELIGKVSNELKELQEAKRGYEIERMKFLKLNVEYKKRMDKFFEQINIKKEGYE